MWWKWEIIEKLLCSPLPPQHKELNLYRNYGILRQTRPITCMGEQVMDTHSVKLPLQMPVGHCVSLLIVFLMRNHISLMRRWAGQDNTHSSKPNHCHSLMQQDKPLCVVIVDVEANCSSPGLPGVSVFSLSCSCRTLVNWVEPKPRPHITAGQSALQTDLQAESQWYSWTCSKAAETCEDRPELWLKQWEPNILFSTLALMVLFSRMHTHGGISVFLAHF